MNLMKNKLLCVVICVCLDNGTIYAMETVRNVSKRERRKQIELDSGLLSAAYNGNVSEINTLLSQNANITYSNYDKQTALHLAAEKNHADAANALIKAGAHLNAKSRSCGQTPLHTAVSWHSNDAAKALIEAGANLAALDTKHKMTPLQLAIHLKPIPSIFTLITTASPLDIQPLLAGIMATQRTFRRDIAKIIGRQLVKNLIEEKFMLVKQQLYSSVHESTPNKYTPVDNIKTAIRQSINRVIKRIPYTKT